MPAEARAINRNQNLGRNRKRTGVSSLLGAGPQSRGLKVRDSGQVRRVPCIMKCLSHDQVEGTIMSVNPRKFKAEHHAPIHAPHGTRLSCKGWHQEAAMRMLMNIV